MDNQQNTNSEHSERLMTLLFTDGPPPKEPKTQSSSSVHPLSDPETYSSPSSNTPPTPTPTATRGRTPLTFSDGKMYEFDKVFHEYCEQEEVYQVAAAPLVSSIFQGFSATVFAYGATSSGKTHTMVGGLRADDPGIMKRAIEDIFGRCEGQVEVYISYLEIYNERIRDLLRPLPGVYLELREDNEQVHVVGLMEYRATSTSEALNLLQKGHRARTMEPTTANLTSSRSHAILILTVRQYHPDERSTEGKLYLIDLAGSERASQTKKNSGLRLREGGHINRSLLALGNCITALANGDDKFINYRDSKLTRLLKTALGGPSKTVMIAHVSPSPSQREETKNTLLYAQKARRISNRVRKFEHIYNNSGMIIEGLRNEVGRLQSKLFEERGGGGASPYNRKQRSNNNYINNNNDNNYLRHSGNEGIKGELSSLFQRELKHRADALKLDGALLQTALDLEILRLTASDYKDMEGERREGLVEEIQKIRQVEEKLLKMRGKTEQSLLSIRTQINKIEEDAEHFDPRGQREVLSLLCKLQKEQLAKISWDIGEEFKRRGALLVGCLRERNLRPFLPRIKESWKEGSCSSSGGEEVLGMGSAGASSSSAKLPPLSTIDEVPKTTKYSEYRKQRLSSRSNKLIIADSYGSTEDES